MNIKRIVAIIVFVIGVALLFVSSNIKKQVAEGTLKVKKAEKTVGQASSLFSLTPATKELSKGAMKGAEKKIAAGKEELAYYTKLADELQMGGLVLIGAGILTFILGRGHNEKNRSRS